jgi:hypothetical protein
MGTSFAALAIRLLPAAALMLPAAVGRADEQPESITVHMEACKAVRPAKIASLTDVLAAIVGGGKEELVPRGEVQVEGKKYVLYLPKAKSYSVKHSKPGNDDSDNTSTLLSIDQTGEGVGGLAAEDGWPANLPIRLGDAMFDVTDIAADGGSLVLRPSKAPLRGVIAGRRCPAFSFRAADGRDVALDGLKGKVVVLDVWSVT